VAGFERTPMFPQVPSMKELGYPRFNARQWYGMFAPAGTPRDIIMKVHAATLRGLQDPTVRKRLNEDGAEPTPNATPEEFGAMLRAEIAKWGKVVKAAGIQPE
jgi:tripartite-type tricarboxylate transporter receptor subunit TctC